MCLFVHMFVRCLYVYLHSLAAGLHQASAQTFSNGYKVKDVGDQIDQQEGLASIALWLCVFTSISLLIVGCVLLSFFARMYKHVFSPGFNVDQKVVEPPDDLAGFLVKNHPHTVFWEQFQATFFDLINRRIITFHALVEPNRFPLEPIHRSWLNCKHVQLISSPMRRH